MFDEIERVCELPADHLIGKFDYLNESGRIEAGQIRTVLDEWIGRYPTEKRAALVGRFRSRHDSVHTSAFFELFLHELMLTQGFTIVEIEPETPNGTTPDFLVEKPDRTRFYLEATLATGRSDTEAGADRRLREALQAIDSVASPDFFLHLRTNGVPERPIAVANLRRSVQRFVDGLDYTAAIRNVVHDRPNANNWEHAEHGVQFEIEAVPKRNRGRGHRAIGGRTLPGGIIEPHLAIKSAVENKAGRYGQLEFPLVIAVNALNEYARIVDALDALFGTVGIVVGEGGQARSQRNADGAWRGPAGPVYTRSSGVLFLERLSAWNIAQRTCRLILNPWAQNPIQNIGTNIEVRHVVENNLITEPGQPNHQLLGLHAGWPE